MGKEKGFALTPVRTRDMRRFLEHRGYRVVPGQHKHLKLRHDSAAEVLLPLRPGDNLSHPPREADSGCPGHGHRGTHPASALIARAMLVRRMGASVPV